MTEDVIKVREEMHDQILALEALKKWLHLMGLTYQDQLKQAQEAVQWTYFGYLAAIKDQNGAAMSLGKTAGFLDIYEKEI